MLGPTLRGERVTLFPTGVDDLPLWRADLDVIHYLPYRFVPSAEQEDEWHRRMATSEREILWSVDAQDEVDEALGDGDEE